MTYHGTTVTETTKNGDTQRTRQTHAAPDWVAKVPSPTPLMLTSLTEHHERTEERQQGMTGLASLVTQYRGLRRHGRRGGHSHGRDECGGGECDQCRAHLVCHPRGPRAH